MFYKVCLDKLRWHKHFLSAGMGFIVGSTIYSSYALANSQVSETDNLSSKGTELAQTGIEEDPLPEPQPLPPAGADPVLPVPPSLPEDEAPVGDIQIEVREIQVFGSTVFEPEVLQGVVSPFENRELTLADLQQAADALTELYLQAGYITSRAVLPDQTTEDGIIQILVIEGALSDIRVEGTSRLAGYVRDRVGLGAHPPLNQFQLEDQLRLLQFDPLFDDVEANLSAADTLGESLLTVEVTEAKPLKLSLVSDNYSPESIGNVRLGANISYLNPAGLGDTFFTSAYVSPGGASNVYELGYRVPLNAKDGALQVRYVSSNFTIVNPEAVNLPSDIDISGSADSFSLGFRQPLIRTPREEFAVSAGFRHRSGETLIFDFPTDSDVSVLEFGQDYLRRDTRGAWAFLSQFSIGTGLFDASVEDSASPDSGFFSWQGQAQRVQLLGPNQTLILQANLQFSSDALLGSEQFIVGGGQSVRGYSQNVQAGDNGFRFSAEDRFVLLRNETNDPFLQIAPFLDLAVVWGNDNAEEITSSDDEFLLGSGVGVILNPTPKLDIRLDLGIPLVDIDDPGNSESTAQVYFQFIYSPLPR